MISKTKIVSLCIAMLVFTFSIVFYLSQYQKPISGQNVTVTSDDHSAKGESLLVSEIGESSERVVERDDASLSDELAVPNTQVNTVEEAPTVEDIVAFTDVNPNYSTFEDRITTVVARRHGEPVDTVKLWKASQKTSAWESYGGVPSSLILSNRQKFDGREFIKIDPLKIESLVHGDTFEITIAQVNQTYTAHITNVVSEDEGRNVTWSGYLEDLEQPNSLTLTRGSDLIVGGISTPEALYSLQAHGDTGWIVDSATLFVGGDEPIVVTPDIINSSPEIPNS